MRHDERLVSLYKGEVFEEMLQRRFFLSFSDSKQSINECFLEMFFSLESHVTCFFCP